MNQYQKSEGKQDGEDEPRNIVGMIGGLPAPIRYMVCGLISALLAEGADGADDTCMARAEEPRHRILADSSREELLIAFCVITTTLILTFCVGFVCGRRSAQSSRTTATVATQSPTSYRNGRFSVLPSYAHGAW